MPTPTTIGNNIKMILTRPIFISLTTAIALIGPQALADMDSARNQYFAKEYRALCELPTNTFETAQSPAEAAQQSLSVSTPLAMTLKLNNDGQAYLNLSVENWDQKLVVFHSTGINIEMKDADTTGQNITNQQCDQPDMTITHINTHEWGSYPVKVVGAPNETITLKIHQEQDR